MFPLQGIKTKDVFYAPYCRPATVMESDGFWQVSYLFIFLSEDKLCHGSNNKPSASLHLPQRIWFYPAHQKTSGGGRWYQWSNHFQMPTQQCQLITWIRESAPPRLFLSFPTTPHCSHPPVTLCISALGRKHYMGQAQGSVSLNILSWLLAVILLMTGVSSPTYIRTRATGGEEEERGEEEKERAASSTRREKYQKKGDQKPKCVETCWCFLVWTKDATSLKFHMWFLSLLTIPKITKDYFSLHGLCEWFKKKRCCIVSPPSLSLTPPFPPSSPLHASHPPALNPCGPATPALASSDSLSIALRR